MSRRSLFSLTGSITVGAVVGAALHAASLPAASRPIATPPTLGVCPAYLAPIAERTYAVGARVKFLLFWSGRHDEGDARLVWSADTTGVRRTELLVGTDPERAFRGLNRWGYLAETTCEAGAEVVGVMTTSDEASVEEAKASLDASGQGSHAYRAIRATLATGESVADLVHLSGTEACTYRDVQTILDRLPVAGAPRRRSLPAHADTGFLAATSRLVADSIAHQARTERGLSGVKRTYVYGATMYVLALRSSAMKRALTIGTTTFASPIEMAFEIVNTDTQETTPFSITVGTTGDTAGVPLRMVYRPRWWLELDLTLTTQVS